MRFAWIGIGCVTMALGGYAAGEEIVAPASAAAPATTRPATRPSDSDLDRSSVDSTLERMLRTKPGSVRPLQPVPENGQTTRSVKKLDGESVDLMLKREGDMITDRVGRLQTTPTGQEFHFESDGRALNDPPMALLPNSVLAQMEAAVEKSGRDLRFRVTGMITTYHGQNYLLVEKARAVSKADEE